MSRFKEGDNYTIKLSITDPIKAQRFITQLLSTMLSSVPYRGTVVLAVSDLDVFTELDQANELLDRAANIISQTVTIGGDDEKLLDDIEGRCKA